MADTTTSARSARTNSDRKFTSQCRDIGNRALRRGGIRAVGVLFQKGIGWALAAGKVLRIPISNTTSAELEPAGLYQHHAGLSLLFTSLARLAPSYPVPSLSDKEEFVHPRIDSLRSCLR